MPGKNPKTPKIETLQYRKIEAGFYQVLAITDDEKISFEGNMCEGLLKEFIKKAKQQGAKIERVKKLEPYNMDELEDLSFLRKYAKYSDKNITKAIKILQNILDSSF